MSILDFGRNAIVAKMGNVGDGVMSWYASHDPETASAADIAVLREHVVAVEHRIAELEGKVAHDQHEIEALTQKLTRDQQAAAILGQRLQEAKIGQPNAPQVTQYTSQLSTLLTEMERLAGQDGTCMTNGSIFEANTTLSVEQANLQQFRDQHARFLQDWTTAQSRLDRSRADMELAAHQREAAEQQAAQAERDAGLLRRPAAGSTALNAMEQRAAKEREAARAATLHAQGLRSVAGSDADSITNSVLSAQQPQQDDVLARLARMTGRQ
jgi:chromosome segregation ATPase